MQIVKSKDTLDIINKTVNLLKKGGLVVFPTDTVYGLLADAKNEEAVRKLLNFKERPHGKPISIFVANFEMLWEQVHIDKKTAGRLKELLPGPYTIVLSSKHRVSPLLESEKGTLGVRLPDYSPITELVKAFGHPVTATSANLAGRSPSYSIDTLIKQLPKNKQAMIDLIVDAGTLPRNKPSTVLDFTVSTVKVLRQGDILPTKSGTRSASWRTKSEAETKKAAQEILKQALQEKGEKPIVFILQGELGTGKTVFVKGIGEYLGIKNIISPTFVVYYEYPVLNNQYVNTLIHCDLYNIADPEEFKHLGLERYLKKGNVLAIEWGEKSGGIFEKFEKKGYVVFVKIKHVSEKKREVFVNIHKS